MSYNTRSEPAVLQGQELFQGLTPPLQTEPEVLLTHVEQQIVAIDAFLSLEKDSTSVSNTNNELFSQFCRFPEDDESQDKVPTPITNDLCDSAGTNRDNTTHANQETDPKTTNAPPNSAERLDLEQFMITFQAAVDQSEHGTFEGVESEELAACIRSLDYQNDSRGFWAEGAGITAGSNTHSGLARESQDETSLQTAVNDNSLPSTTPAHISSQAFATTPILTTTPATPTVASSQLTTAAYLRPSATDAASFFTVATSGGPSENFTSGGAIVNNNFVNNLNIHYQAPSPVVPQQSQLNPSVNRNASSPTTQAHLATPAQQPIQTRVSVPSRGATPKPRAQKNLRALLGSTFKSTPLKQSWTSGDLKAEEQKDSVAITPYSQAQTSIQTSVVARDGPPTGAGPGASSNASALVVAPPTHFHSGPAANNHRGLKAGSQFGTTGAAHAHTSSQPQGPVGIVHRSALQNSSINGAAPVQRAHSCPQLQAAAEIRSATPNRLSPAQPNGVVQAGSALPGASTRPYTYAPQGLQVSPSDCHSFLTAPLGRTESHAAAHAPHSTKPSFYNQPIAPAGGQGYYASGYAASSYNQAQPSTPLPRNSNYHTGAMPLTPRPSPTGTYPPAQSPADLLTHLQGFAQPPRFTTRVSGYMRDRAQATWGPSVTDVIMVQGLRKDEWYHVVMAGSWPVAVYLIPWDVALRWLPGSPEYSGSISHPDMPAQVQQQAVAQPVSQGTYEAPQPVHEHEPVSPRPPAASSLPPTNGQGYMRQSHPVPVQRSYSSPSLATQAPEIPFTVAAPPPTAFKPRSGDESFSLAFWRQGQANQASASQSPRTGPCVPQPAHANGAIGYTATPGPSNRPVVNAPGPSTSTSANAHTPALLAAPSPNMGTSSLGGSSRSWSSQSSNSPALAPSEISRKRRVVANVDDDEIQHIPSSGYKNTKNKRAKVERT